MNLSNFKLSTLTDWSNLLPTVEQRTPHSSHSFTSLILQPQTLHQHGGVGPRVVSQAKGSRGSSSSSVAIISYSFSSRIRDDGRHASKRLLPQQDLANANEAGRGRPNRTKLARSLSKQQQQRTLWIGSARNQNAVKNPGGRNTLNQMGHAPQPPGGKQSGVRKVNSESDLKVKERARVPHFSRGEGTRGYVQTRGGEGGKSCFTGVRSSRRAILGDALGFF